METTFVAADPTGATTSGRQRNECEECSAHGLIVPCPGGWQPLRSAVLPNTYRGFTLRLRSRASASLGCRNAYAAAWQLRSRGDRRRSRLQQLRWPDRRGGPRSVIDAALDVGVTFFDTADVYGNRGGSEEIIGARSAAGATRSCSRRSSATTSATARPPVARAPHPQGDRSSLRRLQTDRVDLYQYHRPDGVTPIEETLGALHGSSRKARCSRSAPPTSRPNGRGGARDRRRAALTPSSPSRASLARPRGGDELLPPASGSASA